MICLMIAFLLLVPLPDDDQPRSVILEVGGVTYPVTTFADTVAEFVMEQDLTIETGDMLYPGLTEPIEADMRIQINRARTVSVTVDGRTTILRTVFDNPLDILRSAGVQASDTDQIRIDGTLATPLDLIVWPQPVQEIDVRRAINVTLVEGESRQVIHTTGDTVGDVLFEAGINLFLADSVTPDTSTLLEPDMEILIDRSRDLTIIADGVRFETRTHGETVADALTEAGVALVGLDYTIPSENSPVVSGMNVRVIRVTEELVSEDEVIEHETLYQADPETELDRRRLLQSGQNGLLRRTYRVRYENGIEIERELVTEEQVTEVQDEIIGYGTNIVIRTLETPEGTLQYWRKLSVYTTSYHPAALGGDNITATGEVLRKGIIGVNPRIIPYYTNLYVEGYGTGFAADTGAPRTNPYWIDLGYEDHDWEHWAGWEDIYLLTPVPDDVRYLLPAAQRGGPMP